MALKRNVGWNGLRYKGGGPMLSWSLHRISGIAIVLLVGSHILASFFMQQFGSDFGTSINIIYESVYFQVGIYFVVLFHALNGLRIVILDTWPQLLEYQREAIWLQWLVFLPIYGLTIFIMLSRAISGS